MLGFGFNKDKVRASADKFVQQGKLQNAIAEYDKILKSDPKDLTVLNTVGDLYSRLGQTDRALQCFKQVGDNYAAEGFVPKAIAMYKKLTKLSPNSYDCVQKLGELYTQQGLYNDARAQFLLAADGLMRGGQADEAINILKRLLEVDPENAGVQTKLADMYLKQGKREDAKKILLSAAESMYQRNSVDAAAEILARLLSIDKENSRARMMQGQILLEKGDAPGAVKSLELLPDIDSRPDALRTMMRALLATGQITEAEPIARKLFTVHHDISAIASVTEKVVAIDPLKGLKYYEEFGDQLIAASPANVVASLRGLVTKVSGNVTSLEVLLKLFQRAGDTSQNSEIFELIAHACVQSGQEADLRRAAQLYKELAQIEPENPLHLQNYRQVLTKLGEDPTVGESTARDSEVPFAMQHSGAEVDWNAPAKLSSAEVISGTFEETSDASAGAEFSRATQQHSLAGERSVAAFEVAPEIPVEPIPFQATSIPSFEVEATGAGTVTEFSIPDSLVSSVPEPFGASSVEEVHDLSDEWEKHVAEPETTLIDRSHVDGVTLLDTASDDSFRASVQPIPDLIEEIKFYISQQMWHEAGSGLAKLEEIAPSNDQLSTLREQLASAQGAPPAEVSVNEEAVVSEIALDSAVVESEEVIEIAAPPVPEAHAAAAPATPGEEAPVTPSAAPAAAVVPPAPPAPKASDDILGEFVSDLESSLGDDFTIATATPVPAKAVEPAPATMSAAASVSPISQPAPIPAAPAPVISTPVQSSAPSASKDSGLLDDLFDEFKSEMGETADQSPEDPETHYNLGVAFKEMGLLDEAIGELQKVSQSIERGVEFSQTMQAYTWLANCFVEKGVPEASFMWFERALTVAKDNDVRAAILYELGSAYELANQRDKAREAFTKVMSINIDFRDVGERIKALKS